MTATVENPYLAGNFAPVTDERDDAELPVTGAIPPELDGHPAAQRPEPDHARPAELPLVRRRRDAPRRRAARRRRSLPEPLGAHRRRVRRARRGAAGRSARRRLRGRLERRQHARRRPRGPDPRARRGLPPDRGAPGPHDRRALRLRRRAAIRDDRAPEDRPADRRDALLRLRHHGPAVPALPRGRRLGCARAHGSDHARRAGDGARLRDHPAVRRLARPAHRLRLRPAREAALPGEVDAGAPRPRRCDAA